MLAEASQSEICRYPSANCMENVSLSPSLIDEFQWNYNQDQDAKAKSVPQDSIYTGDATNTAVDHIDPKDTLDGSYLNDTEGVSASPSNSRSDLGQKRKLMDMSSKDECIDKRRRRDCSTTGSNEIVSEKLHDTCDSPYTDYLTDSGSESCSECTRKARSESIDSCGKDGKTSVFLGMSPKSSQIKNRRTLCLEYWTRSEECKQRKWDHLDGLRERYDDAKDHIFDTSLKCRTAFLEPNMFPYMTPPAVEHWTLWHVRELTHEQIKQYVENWIDANAPHVKCWNYDDNPQRSIDIFHVHVYLQASENDSVLQGRNVEDLMHELD